MLVVRESQLTLCSCYFKLALTLYLGGAEVVEDGKLGDEEDAHSAPALAGGKR